jgi:hypothetical protein
VTPRRACVVLVALALLMSACGGASSLSARQLRARATRACAAATARLDSIPTPKAPAAGASFLRRGIAALGPELARLATLHPTGELGAAYDRARTATEQELAALKSSLKGLRAGNDPVVAIKTLQTELVGLEKRATAAWRQLEIPGCVDT